MVQGFESLARRHRAVADHGDDAPLFAFVRGGERHAERGADRSARVADAERVVLAFEAARERREPALELDRLQPVAAAGQHLVRVGLVADVPDQAVVRRVEDVVQRDRQFDRAEAGGEMTAHLADRLDQEFAHFVRERGQLRRRQLAQVGRGLDFRQQRVWVDGPFAAFYTERAMGRPATGCGSAASPTDAASEPLFPAVRLQQLRRGSRADSRTRARAAGNPATAG